MPLIPALRRKRQVDLSEFEASLVYKVSSRTARAATQRNPVLKNKQKNVERGVGRVICKQYTVLQRAFDHP